MVSFSLVNNYSLIVIISLVVISGTRLGSELFCPFFDINEVFYDLLKELALGDRFIALGDCFTGSFFSGTQTSVFEWVCLIIDLLTSGEVARFVCSAF